MCECWAGLSGAPFKMSNLYYTYYYFLMIFLFHSQSLVYARCIDLKQRCVPHTNTNTPAMISTYGGVLSAIEKILQKLMEEYQGVGKLL